MAGAAQHYAAIVELSDDAILSRDLEGVILSWNQGAERLFGYAAEEAIGQPAATLFIPPDRRDEELELLERIRRGEGVRGVETARQRKDGSLVDISLTISPIRDLQGRIVGASTIARDITESRRTQERQELLLREMSHRVKNLFALSGSIVGLSARGARTTQELADSARQRLAALARAHALTFSHGADEPSPQPTTLASLIRTVGAPFDESEATQASRIAISGADPSVSGVAGHQPCSPFARVCHQRREIRRSLRRRRDRGGCLQREGRCDHTDLDGARRTAGRGADWRRGIRRPAVAHDRRPGNSGARFRASGGLKVSSSG